MVPDRCRPVRRTRSSPFASAAQARARNSVVQGDQQRRAGTPGPRLRAPIRMRAIVDGQPASSGSRAPQLDLGLGELGRRIGVGDDAGAGVEVGGAIAQQRRAQRDAELAVVDGVHPADRARVPAAVEHLEVGDQPLPLRAARLRSDGRGRVQEPGQLEDGARLGQLGVDRGRQVLDVRDLDDDGLGRALDPDRDRGEPAFDPPGDDRVLGPVLVAVQKLLAEVVVDGRVGAAPGRPRQRDGRGDAAAAADEQLGAGADEGAPPACPRRSRSRSRTPLAARRTATPGECAEGAVTRTSRASTSLSTSPLRMILTASATAAS